MLIDHSERAYQALHRPLTPAERDDLYDVFYRIGLGLGIPDLPTTYDAWLVDRDRHLQNDLAVSELSRELDRSYEREVGWWRMVIVRQLQAVLSPERVLELAGLPRHPWIRPLMPLHGLIVRLGLRRLAQRLLVPSAYLPALRALEPERAAGRP